MSDPTLDLARVLQAHTTRLTRRQSRPVQIAKVLTAKPLAVELFEGGLKLDAEDLIVPKAVKKYAPKAGEFVTVAQVHTDEYVVLGAVSAAAAGSKQEKEEEEDAGENAIKLLKASGVGMIVHGKNPSTPRGTDFAHYIWVGTVTPENAADDDILTKFE